MRPTLTRRELIAVAALLAGGLTLAQRLGTASNSSAPEPEPPHGQPPAAYAGKFRIKPLPFDPAKLDGLSERLIRSHHENNYGGAVRRLNDVQIRIAQLPKDAPPYLIGSLKREEVRSMNSMILHELYFGNLGGTGSPAGQIEKMIRQAYGGLESWEQDFRATGQSLSGGSGWVVLALSPRDRQLVNVWMSDHLVNLAWGVPLLVMDMYEHSYQMDYGADAKRYIDAFFRNINWDEVEARAERTGV